MLLIFFSDLQKLKDDEQSITQMKLAYEKQLQSERTLKTQVQHSGIRETHPLTLEIANELHSVKLHLF